MSNYLWILDNGHGGLIDGEYQTKGKRSPKWGDGSQLFEGEFNRAIVGRLIELMTAAGIHYVNLVPEHEDISLTERVRRANEIYSKENLSKERGHDIDIKPCIYLSVHSNAGGGKGYEVYTSKGHTQADLVATIFFDKFKTAFPSSRMRACMVDGDVDKEANFTVLNHTHMPAILTESFFMDNEDECKRYLMTPLGRQTIARAHFEAVRDIERNGIRRV